MRPRYRKISKGDDRLSNTNLYGNWWETEVGSEILKKKYFHDYENLENFLDRVSGIFSTPELRSAVRTAIIDADFFPAGRSLYAAGSKGKFHASMSNCYIMRMPEDNIEDIFEVAKETARIFSMGGGVGINISNLRPNGSKVNNAAKTSTGAVSFMEIFDSVGNVIGANNRRAALILGLNCSHPDIEEFLDIKKNNDKIQSANISILFDDAFMEAVRDNKEYQLKFTVKSTGEVIEKTINARSFFLKFAEAQYDWAEPGALFIDRVRKYNLLSAYPNYRIDICNPCAEYTGSAYNACNLGSINLYNMVKQPFTSEATIDYFKLEEAVELGVTALDEILDYGYDSQPLEANRDAIDDYRAIGLGVFGLADTLIALGIRYGSEESIAVVNNVMDSIVKAAVQTSALLAKDKGTFGKYNWDYISQAEFMHTAIDKYTYELVRKHGLRNGSLLSIAPTGSISTMCGISGGLEPLFALSYERTTHALEKTGKKFKVFAKSIEHLFKSSHPWGIESFNADDFKVDHPYAVTTHDIDPFDRIDVQAVIQEHVDNAISSTVNLKNDATVQQVFDAYVYAWGSGCKGLTIFRDGCKRNAILVTSDKPKTELKKLNSISPIKRGNIKRINGSTIVGHTACSPKLYTTVNVKDGDVFEVFTNVTNGCKSNISSITKLISLALRSGIKVDEIVEELKSSQCPACGVLRQQGRKDISNSCGACIGEAIELAYEDIGIPIEEKPKENLLVCPECGEPGLIPTGKCFNCAKCGWSRCE